MCLMTVVTGVFHILMMMFYINRGTGRFLAVLHLRTGDSTLTVVETNQFKHLSHLSLVFRQGNDNVIKQFLAGRLAEYKVRVKMLQKFVRNMCERNPDK